MEAEAVALYPTRTVALSSPGVALMRTTGGPVTPPPVVILTGLEGLREETAQALLYVGITRARSHLIVVERAAVLKKWGMP